jgi:membrane fusion protein (multidrug efflux system)
VLILAAFLILCVGGGIAALAYLSASSKTVYIDKAQIQAPIVELGPTAAGTLRAVNVQEGDVIAPNTVVAQVGTEPITSTSGGLVIMVNNNIGAQINPGDAVVETIDPTQLRVVGQIEEDKGLVDIQPGQRAEFTVDAFGGEKFTGVVDEVAPTSNSSDVVFSISDKREEQNFDVKVRFDTTANPQLKNGMSAKIWVYKN